MNVLFFLEDYKSKFPKGTIITSCFGNRRCIIIVDKFTLKEDKDGIDIHSIAGITASNNPLYRKTFGTYPPTDTPDTYLRLATDEEIQTLFSILDPQLLHSAWTFRADEVQKVYDTIGDLTSDFSDKEYEELIKLMEGQRKQ